MWRGKHWQLGGWVFDFTGFLLLFLFLFFAALPAISEEYEANDEEEEDGEGDCSMWRGKHWDPTTGHWDTHTHTLDPN